jgi:hypothetical protein
MTLEQIRRRGAEVSARLAALAAVVQREGRTLSPTEVRENESLEREFETLAEDERAAALQLHPVHEYGNARPRIANVDPATLIPVRPRGASMGAPAVLSRTTAAQRSGDSFEGQSFARIQLARLRSSLSIAKGTPETAEGILSSLFPQRPELARIAHLHARRMAAGVEGGAVLSGEAGSELRTLDAQYTGDFLAYLHGKTLFDQLPFRRVPADVRIKGQDGAFGGGFVGEKRGIPVSIGSFSSVDLDRRKCAGLTYLSRDLIERSAPAAEMLFRDGLTQALSQAVDTLAFSATAASANVAPAGLVNGITGQASAGGSLSDLFADLAYLTGVLVAAKNSDGQLVYVSNRALANQIAHLVNGTTGKPNFEGKVTMNGGDLSGIAYRTGDNVLANNLLLIRPDDIWVIGDSGVRVELSTSATIEADTAPTGEGVTPTAQSASMVSMFQTDMVAIRAIRDINWAYRRTSTTVTARITAADYNGVASTD